ncbi:hypothetical protein GCM10008956_01800 [Deinococcus arenae]|uniref:Uncharacterized protein n=1 Tax=Deinococcus arenae TaxID=1452751 RepID=A0A8H9GHX3_9DEIO|nr:hypothetical protein [Deinococcus arenae]AWT36076.1 hypothetical protein DM785_11285 [Deinococcus actinosclerus]GGM29492.1 hypothetical protein GCM10008956_01800 [Deinococcus arenae]
MSGRPRSPGELAFGILLLVLMAISVLVHAANLLSRPDDRALRLLCAAAPFVPLLWWALRLRHQRSSWTPEATILGPLFLCMAVLNLSSVTLLLLTGQPLPPARAALLIGGVLSLGLAVLLLRRPPPA